MGVTNKDQCREAFEAWVIQDRRSRNKALHEWTDEELKGVLLRGSDREWAAWQAARSAPSAPVEMPEPAIPASQGVCCGRFDSGGHYMGQTEQVCCGDPVDAHPAYYTEQQVRELLSTAHEARREAQHQLETCKTELAKLERYGFMLSRGALVPAGWVAVPVDPTEAMRSVIINESDIYQSPDVLYAALLAAAPKLPQGDGWLPIESAPKDGSEILLLSRKGRIANGCWMTATDKVGAWMWPYVLQEPTHWMPLPQPPREPGA